MSLMDALLTSFGAPFDIHVNNNNTSRLQRAPFSITLLLLLLKQVPTTMSAATVFAAMAQAVEGPSGQKLKRKFKVSNCVYIFRWYT